MTYSHAQRVQDLIFTMEPAWKAPELEKVLENIGGRSTAIRNNCCIKPPIGCGRENVQETFLTVEDIDEYKNSGLCGDCQEKIFKKG